MPIKSRNAFKALTLGQFNAAVIRQDMTQAGTIRRVLRRRRGRETDSQSEKDKKEFHARILARPAARRQSRARPNNTSFDASTAPPTTSAQAMASVSVAWPPPAITSKPVDRIGVR